MQLELKGSIACLSSHGGKEVVGMLALGLGLASIVVAALTIWHAILKSSTPEDPDARFWISFTGFCVFLPLILITTTISPPVAAMTLLLTAGSCIYVGKLALTRLTHDKAEKESARLSSVQHLLNERHNTVLRRWSHYEIDSHAHSDFPDMHNIDNPEISTLIRALSHAEHLRDLRASTGSMYDNQAYDQAVSSLENAFDSAERRLAGK